MMMVDISKDQLFMICFELYINSSFEYELLKTNGRVQLRGLEKKNLRIFLFNSEHCSIYNFDKTINVQKHGETTSIDATTRFLYFSPT